MKLIAIILTVAALHTSAHAFSQINITVKNSPIEKVLKKIEKQSGYAVFYDTEYLNRANPVSLDLSNASLEESLKKCFADQPFTYEILANTIIITPVSSRLTRQDRVVTGKVTDVNGQPLPGATIRLKSAGAGTVTDAKGNFHLKHVAPDDILVISFTGFVIQEIPADGDTPLQIVLKEDQQALSQVVVIGYGSVAKPDLTGAVGQVNMADMTKAPVGSFAEALAGRLAGVQVSGNDGQPGGDYNITIRGPGSLTQSTSPLFVIDGFPVEDLDPNSLNPDDIESMTVLKDASSAAIYGSRAANGVIVVQTKRGKAGKTAITFNTSIGQNLKRKKIDLMSPYEYIKLQNELFPGAADGGMYTANTPLDYYKDVEGVDLQDYMFRSGPIKKYDMAIRGGNEKTKFAVSGSVYDQEGIVVNTGLNKYTGRLTLDHHINNKFKVGLTTNYSGTNSFGQLIAVNPSASDALSVSLSSYTMYRAWGYRPVTPPYISPETLLDDVDEIANITGDFRINPIIDLENTHNYRYNNILNGNAYASYDLLPELQLKVTGGVNRRSDRNDQFYNSKTSRGSPSNPNNPNGINGFVSYSNVNSWSNENILNYKKVFNGDHTLTGLALFSLFSEKRNRNGYGGRLLPNEGLGMAGLDEGLSFKQESTRSNNTRTSYATRWDYNYKSKYLIGASFRADASSKFPKPWGYFPAGSIGWNMHQEEFFSKALPFVSTSKIRASYGQVGNDRVNDFDWYARLTQTTDGYGYNNQNPTGAVYVSGVLNPELRWEKTTTMNLGYELGFLRNRMELTVDLYKKTTDDLLLNASLPPTTGFSTAFKNIGKLENRGIEFTLNTVNVQTRSFSWLSNFNISFNRNTVLGLAENQQSLQTNASGYEPQYNTPLYIAEIGKPAGMMFGFVWEGNYQYADFDNPSPGTYILKSTVPSNGTAALRTGIRPGDIKYRDLNGDNIIDVNDKTIIGRGQPIHIGGFSNNFSYKAFSADVFFQWSYGNDIYNANRLSFEGNSNARRNLNQYASYADRWSPDNQDSKNFRAGGYGPFGYHSSRVVEDGSYLRLKTVSLSYSLPRKFIQKAYLSNLTFNVAAQNLITWTNYSGLDPEVSLRSGVLTPGYDFSAYPMSRTIVFGLNAAF